MLPGPLTVDPAEWYRSVRDNRLSTADDPQLRSLARIEVRGRELARPRTVHRRAAPLWRAGAEGCLVH